MMWYNNGPRYRNSYRRGGFRGLYGLPWIIFGLIWWGHLSWFIVVPIIVLVIALIAGSQMRRPSAPIGNQGQQYSNSYYTPPIYQPPVQPSQPVETPAETYYQPYGQGYQEQPGEQEPEQRAQGYASQEEQSSSAQEYDLPRAEYPQQMPPME